jgi:subtilisin family serine protease
MVGNEDGALDDAQKHRRGLRRTRDDGAPSARGLSLRRALRRIGRSLTTRAGLVLGLLMVLSLVTPPDTQAASGRRPISEKPTGAGRAGSAAHGSSDGPRNKKVNPPFPSSGRVRVMIELADDPAIVAGTQNVAPGQMSVSAFRSQAATVDRAQQGLLQTLQSSGYGARVIYRVKKVYNGIAADVDAATIPRIEGLPGVKAVHPITPKSISNASTVPLIGAPPIWDGAGADLRGDGIRIGIIDTGIDYIHRNFGGTADYTGSDPTTLADPITFPTSVVVGGTDLAGDAYDADSSDSATNTPQPDDDPMDCNGHGSHVAGSAAGRGVNPDGTTYTGPYDPSTPFSWLKIGPGVAPAADLYAIKVFGCTGTTDLVTDAIEWALDPDGDTDPSDHLDVINMSLGADFGDIDDPDVQASNLASLAGIVVVVAAGNAGDTTAISGTPASATRAISVAASDDSTAVVDGFNVAFPDSIAGAKPASAGILFDWAHMASPVSSILYYPLANQSGCDSFAGSDATTIVSQHPVVLLDWVPAGQTESPCGSAQRAAKAREAGAVGVIFGYNQPNLDLGINGDSIIPSVITTSTVAEELKANLSGPVIVSLDKAYLNSQKLIDSTQVDRIASFSSRGPGTRNGALKPDLTAPGVTVFSTATGTGTEGTSMSGTSMATPHVAGLMALLREALPSFRTDELKALAMNTATQNVFVDVNHGGPVLETTRMGAGRIDVQAALSTPTIAYETDEPGQVSISYGPVEAFGQATFTRTIKIDRKGGPPTTINLGYTPISQVPGTSISFPDGTSFSLSPGGSKSVRVQLNVDAAQVKNARPPSMAATQVGLNRQYLAELTGLVTITPTAAEPASRLPLYAAIRPASDMHAAQTSLAATAPTQTIPLGLTGSGVDNGTAPFTDIRSVVSAFELQAISPVKGFGSAPSDRAGDLRYVGVSSDGRVTNAVADATLYFGLSLEKNWLRPTEEIYFSILIDTNRDGTDDFELYNTELVDGDADGTDVMVTALDNLADNDDPIAENYLNIFDATRPTAIFDNNVLVMPVPVSALSGLSLANTRFNYRVNVYYGGTLRDSSGPLTYDWLKPGVDVITAAGQTPMFDDLPGNSLNVTYNAANYQANNSKGLLLLHHYNRDGQRVEVVSVNKGQTVSFAPGSPTSKVLTDPPFTVTATSSAGLPVTIASQTPFVCTINASSLVTLVAPGTCTLRASQAGNAEYAAAQADLTITVGESACSPRPNIAVNTTRQAPGKLGVSVTAGRGSLQTIRFGTDSRQLQNASVQITAAGGPQTLGAASTVVMSPNTTTQTFTVSQTTPGQALTVPMIVTDSCGPWETFVGLGAGG